MTVMATCPVTGEGCGVCDTYDGCKELHFKLSDDADLLVHVSSGTGIPTQTLPPNPKTIFGVKKAPLHLIPSTALVVMAGAHKLGAEKYGAYNWRKTSVEALTYVAAAERHLRSWLDGEENDVESGVSHLGHAMACMAILIDAKICGKLIDDRPPAAPTAQLIEELRNKK